MADEPKMKPEAIVKSLLPIITSVAVGALVQGVVAGIAKMTVSNIHKSDPAGDSEIHPTKKETDLASDEAAGSSVESNLANDKVNAQSGAVNAAETEAKAATAESTAAETGATASRVKAGASDIETKAMKIM